MPAPVHPLLLRRRALLTPSEPLDYATEVAEDNPVAWWRLEQTSGDMLDEIASHDGTTSGTITKTATALVIGSSNAWDFSDGAVVVPYHADLDAGTGAFSLECWLDADTAGESNLGRIAQFNGPAGGWQIWTNNSGVTFNIAGNSLGVSGAWSYPSGPHHVVCTYDGTTARIFIDGSEALNGARSLNITDTDDLYVGNSPAGDRALDGRLDEIAYYDHELSAGRIAVHYSAGT